jgi:hypothetical protein
MINEFNIPLNLAFNREPSKLLQAMEFRSFSALAYKVIIVT